MTTTTIYKDSLLRASVVVSHDGRLWLVPRRAGGWATRQRLTMTPEAQRERLRPERKTDPAWSDIKRPIERENGPRANEGPTE